MHLRQSLDAKEARGKQQSYHLTTDQGDHFGTIGTCLKSPRAGGEFSFNVIRIQSEGASERRQRDRLS